MTANEVFERWQFREDDYEQAEPSEKPTCSECGSQVVWNGGRFMHSMPDWSDVAALARWTLRTSHGPAVIR